MSDIEQKRKMVQEAYPLSSEWPKKVKKMSDQQVIAVYLRLQGQGRIVKPLN